jgi:hypothetical protein
MAGVLIDQAFGHLLDFVGNLGLALGIDGISRTTPAGTYTDRFRTPALLYFTHGLPVSSGGVLAG